MKWIRLYTKIPHDPKVQQMPGNLFKFWVNLLCLTGEADQNTRPRPNRVPKIHQIAFNLRLRPSRVQFYLNSLVARQLVEREKTDPDCYIIHHWEEYQRVSDFSKDRMRRHRDGDDPVTVTRQSRAAAEQSRREESSNAPAAQLLPPAAAPLSEIIPFAAAACAAAPNQIRAQAEKALLSRADDIRSAHNPEGLALTILADFGISPPPRKTKRNSRQAADDYAELAAEIERGKHVTRGV